MQNFSSIGAVDGESNLQFFSKFDYILSDSIDLIANKFASGQVKLNKILKKRNNPVSHL